MTLDTLIRRFRSSYAEERETLSVEARAHGDRLSMRLFAFGGVGAMRHKRTRDDTVKAIDDFARSRELSC